MTAANRASGAARAIRGASAMVVVACVALPVMLAVRWWPSSLSDRHSTPAAEFTADQSAEFAAFAATAPASRPIILSYHDVLPAGDDDVDEGAEAGAESSIYTVTPEQLESQMAMLEAGGFTSVTSAQMAAYLDGEPLPARSVFITFDDGAKGIWQYADRILERHGFHATAFIITGSVGTRQPYYLTWSELEAMRDNGRWDFGAHTDAGHLRLADDADGDTALPFLLTRAWLPEAGRQETLDEWRVRVATDLDANIDAFVDHGFDRPLMFAHPFAAVTEPTDDPAIPIELDRLIEARFAASVANDPAVTTVGPNQIAARHLLRVAVRAATTTDELFQRLRDISAQSPPA